MIPEVLFGNGPKAEKAGYHRLHLLLRPEGHAVIRMHGHQVCFKDQLAALRREGREQAH